MGISTDMNTASKKAISSIKDLAETFIDRRLPVCLIR